MESSTRLSFSWLHTWFGLALGHVLLMCFFFGSLALFDREFDRWALPQTRFAAAAPPSFDVALQRAMARLRPDPQ